MGNKPKIKPNKVNPIVPLSESLGLIPLKDISPYDYPPAQLFVMQIFEKINTTYTKTSVLKPLLFVSNQYYFLATADLENETHKLKLRIKADIDNSSKDNFDTAVTLLKTAGYTVIEIIIPESDLIDVDKSLNHCYWCGSIVKQHNTKKFEYCCTKCKSTANRFLVTLNGIINEWKQYRQYVSTGETDKANTIKSKSKYAYLLDDSVRYEYIVTTHKLDQFNHPKFVLLNETLKSIKQILRPLVYVDTLQPANYNKEQYDAGKIGPYCPVCGQIIPPDKHIDSKYCSNECGNKVRNMRKKERK